ncbi:21973_t:CDS:2, partial [Cetraspora pellucida]
LNDKKKKLSYLQHKEILYSHKHEDSLATIAKNIKCGKTTMHDTLKQYAQTESTMPRKRPGSKAIFNESALEELRKMVIQDTKHHRLSLKEIQDLWKKKKNQKVSISTIRHALKKCGLKSYIACHKPLISAKNRLEQKAWAEEHLNCYNIRVWHTPAKEFDESCLVPTVGHSPSLMFWRHGLGPIVPIHSTINGE